MHAPYILGDAIPHFQSVYHRTTIAIAKGTVARSMVELGAASCDLTDSHTHTGRFDKPSQISTLAPIVPGWGWVEQYLGRCIIWTTSFERVQDSH